MEELFDYICNNYPDKFVVIADTKTDNIYSFYKGKYVSGHIKDPQGKQYLLLEMFETTKSANDLSKMVLNFFLEVGKLTKLTVEKARTFYHFVQEAIFKFNEENGKVKSKLDEFYAQKESTNGGDSGNTGNSDGGDTEISNTSNKEV